MNPMADPGHLKLLKKGSTAWNTWRAKHLEIQPNFSGADLKEANLSGANLGGANLNAANLSGALQLHF